MQIRKIVLFLETLQSEIPILLSNIKEDADMQNFEELSNKYKIHHNGTIHTSEQGIIDKVGMLLLVPTKNVGKGKIFEDSDVLSLKEGFKLIIKYKGGLYIDENDKIDFDGISSYLIENGIPKQNIVLW